MSTDFKYLPVLPKDQETQQLQQGLQSLGDGMRTRMDTGNLADLPARAIRDLPPILSKFDIESPGRCMGENYASPNPPKVFIPGSEVNEEDLTPRQRHHLRLAKEHEQKSLGQIGAAAAMQIKEQLEGPGKDPKESRAIPVDAPKVPTSELQHVSTEQAVKMREWGKKWAKRHPDASYQDLYKAIQKKFKINIQS